MPNKLYYGDNYEVLQRYLKDESVDLIYLDPPFNSRQDYNVLFAEKDGSKSSSQFHAFEDTWEWNIEAARSYQHIVENVGGRPADVMRAFRTFLGNTDMMAYLAMMAPRLIELKRVLRATGSIYLHCDPTASHYLKILMDAIFTPQSFRNEVVWKRTGSHSAAKRWGDIHDTIFFYTKGPVYLWNEVLLEHNEGYTTRYKNEDAAGRMWADDNLTAPGIRNGDSGAVWRGFDVTGKGSHWKVNLKTVESLIGSGAAKALKTTEKLDLLDAHGFIHWPKRRSGSGSGFPRFKRYLSAGSHIQDVITDIPPINSQAQERLGYPTQKPEALLERIIKASSNVGDVVLDPFCGCGTSVQVAQGLGRNWIGIDITHLAIGLIKKRLSDAFGPRTRESYVVIGEPTDLAGAARLAEDDKYQFQWWALGLVGARPVEQKKGADRGIDGRIYFHDGSDKATKQIVLSVKAGENLTPAFVRDLSGVVQRENAQIGVLITLTRPTKEMRKDASSYGFYESSWGKHPRIQILTAEQLLGGQSIDRPPTHDVDTTLKKRPRSVASAPKQLKLPG